MVTLRFKALLALGLLFCMPGLVFANGFRIPDQGARGMGMANAATAQGTDATALYTNPAAVGELDGTYSASGFTLIYATGSEFRSDGIDPDGAGPGLALTDQDADDDLFYPGHLFFVTDAGTERWNFGLGIFTPFGLGRDWDEDRGLERNLDEVDLAVVAIQPSVTYEVMDDLYVAAFAQIAASKINFRASPEVFLGAAGFRDAQDIDLSADGTGYGWGLASYWEPCDWAQIGAIFRSEVTIHYDGHGESNDIQPALQPLLGGRSSFETDLETEIHAPAQASLGIAIKPTDEWLIELDCDFTGWQSFRNVSVKLDQQLRLATGGAFFTDDSLSLRSSWHNAFTWRLGAQYSVNEAWRARMGYVYDQNPVPDHTLHPSLPDSDRHGVTVGVGHTMDDWTFDFSYMALFFEDRDIDNGITAPQNPRHAGTYEGMAHLWAFTIGKKW